MAKVKQEKNERTITTRNISDFYRGEYVDYAQYVLSTRALPSIVDGFKVGARKIMHAAMKGALKDGKDHKFLNLAGDTLNYSHYNHGDTSLHGTISTLGSYYSDNLHPLQIIGQGGTLRDSSSAAPRYLSVQTSKYFGIYKTDIDLAEQQFDDGAYVEPEYFFPIIPTVLTSRTSGMGIGYSFGSMSYNPLDLIDSCIDVLLSGRTIRPIRPFVKECTSNSFVYDAEDARWYSCGKYDIDISSGTVRVTALPFDVDYSEYETLLNSLLHTKYIKNWAEYNEDERIDYLITFDKAALKHELLDGETKLIRKLKLVSTVQKDNLTVLLPGNKIHKFESPNQLIEHFIGIRSKVYGNRKTKLLMILPERLEYATQMMKFLQAVVDGKLVIANRALADIIADLDAQQFPHEFMDIKLSRITKEAIQEQQRIINSLNAEIEYIKNTPEIQMYLNDLSELRTKIANDFA